MAYTDIDKVNGRTIRKLHDPKDKTKCFGYISGIKDDAGDLTEVQKHGNLTEARSACGFKHVTTKVTAPKSSYAQNQKGYDPHSGKKVA